MYLCLPNVNTPIQDPARDDHPGLWGANLKHTICFPFPLVATHHAGLSDPNLASKAYPILHT